MRRSRMPLLGLVPALWLVALSAFGARAARVKIADGSECADPARLQAALTREGIVATGEGATADADVEVRRDGSAFAARLSLRSPDGSASTRTLTAATCEEALAALAFALAVAIDHPSEAAADAAAPAVLADASDAATADVDAPAVTPAMTPAAAASPPAAAAEARSVSPAPSDGPEPAHSDAPPHRFAPRFGVDASGGVIAGASPVVLPAIGISGEIARSRDRDSARLRVGAFATVPVTTSSNGMGGRFALQAARLDICPIALFEVLWPCARGEIGRIQAAADASGAQLANGVWAVAQGALDLEWSPVQPLYLRIDAALGPALSRPAFLFGTSQLYAVPAISSSGAIAAGFHFP